MIKEAMERLLSLSRPEVINVEGRPMILKDREPAIDPYPEPLYINNLTGLVDYCVLEPEPEAYPAGFIIHVCDYNRVFLYQKTTGLFNQREAIIVSQANPTRFQFGRQYNYEEFIIAMHTSFVPNDDRDYILKFTSSIRVDANAKVDDDGVTQTVTARQGASSLVKDIPIKNIVNLRPYRTFSEIDQPESVFVFRMKVAEGKPVFSIHEADGQAWKHTAVLAIKEYLEKTLDIPIIA